MGEAQRAVRPKVSKVDQGAHLIGPADRPGDGSVPIADVPIHVRFPGEVAPAAWFRADERPLPGVFQPVCGQVRALRRCVVTPGPARGHGRL